MTDDQEMELWATAANGIVKRVNASLKKSNDIVRIAELLMDRIVQSGNTLRVLHDYAKKHDWTWDGASILRTIYDATLQALYIFHEDKERDQLARRFLDFGIVEQVKMIRMCDSLRTDLSRRVSQSKKRASAEPAILREFKRVCKKYSYNEMKPPSNWYKGSLCDLAKKAGYESEYEILQKTLSSIVHSSMFGISNPMRIKGPNLIRYQWYFSFRILEKLAAYAGVELTKTERALVSIAKKNIFDK